MSCKFTRTPLAILLVVAILSTATWAGEEAPAPEERAPSPLFYLHNATRIAGAPQLEALTVKTAYGELKIPLGDLLMVRFAQRLSDAQQEKARQAVQALGSEDFDAREEAMEALVQLGPPVLRLLKKALKSEDEEVRTRAEALSEEIRKPSPSQNPDDDDLTPITESADDEVVAERFTVRGRVLEQDFTIQSRYGVLQLARKDVVGIIFQQGKKVSGKAQVTSNHSVPSNWLKTKITLRAGLKITLKASGRMNQPNYGVTCGPEGTTRHSGSTFQGFPMLSLVGKFGKRGKPFLVGRQYKGKVSVTGPLYLGVVPFRRGYQATGHFDVKIKAAP